MSSELIVVVVVEALDGGVPGSSPGQALDGAVHAFHLTVGPGVLRLCGAMIDVGLGAGIFEGMGWTCRGLMPLL